MRKMIFAYYLMVVLMFSTTVILTAETYDRDWGSITVVGEDENSSLTESEDFGDDYFWGGYKLNFTGSADDLYLMGRSIEFEGLSNGALTAFGDSVRIDGDVAKNMHSAANDIRITGTVAETSFIAAQDITVAESAVMDGTLISASNTLHILGHLNSGLLAGAGEIIIDGPVKGDVSVRTGKLIITERGTIEGNLTYGANSQISEKEKARVSGIVKFEEDDKIDDKDFSAFCVIAGILFFAAMAIAGVLLLLLPAVRKAVETDREIKSYGKTVLWGLIPLFIYPVAVLVTIPLFPISIALALGAFLLWFVSALFGLTLIGQLLFKVFKWENDNRFLHFLLAFGIYVVLSMIPVLSVVVFIGVAAMGAGLLIGKLFNTEF